MGYSPQALIEARQQLIGANAHFGGQRVQVVSYRDSRAHASIAPGVLIWPTQIGARPLRQTTLQGALLTWPFRSVPKHLCRNICAEATLSS
jgi:hypothetical protein